MKRSSDSIFRDICQLPYSKQSTSKLYTSCKGNIFMHMYSIIYVVFTVELSLNIHGTYIHIETILCCTIQYACTPQCRMTYMLHDTPGVKFNATL